MMPEENRERALAVLRALEEQLVSLLERLPDGPESAVQFHVDDDQP